MKHNRVRYGLRRNGVVYDWKEYPVQFSNTHLVDFWVADATCLHTVNGQVGQPIRSMSSTGTSPTEYLQELSRVDRMALFLSL